MKRIAIIVNKSLERGQVGNTAAILMGQAVLLSPGVYGEGPIKDGDGHLHAAIRYSTVLLEANSPVQLSNFLKKIQIDAPHLMCILFSKAGQNLNNAYEQYCRLVSGQHTEQLEPVGAIVIGEDQEVRESTKKFSLLR